MLKSFDEKEFTATGSEYKHFILWLARLYHTYLLEETTILWWGKITTLAKECLNYEDTEAKLNE